MRPHQQDQREGQQGCDHHQLEGVGVGDDGRLLGKEVLEQRAALVGLGGRRGPDLNGVGTRLNENQLIDQVSNGTPGGGNMPAYGQQINPAEMTALVSFLSNLRSGE